MDLYSAMKKLLKSIDMVYRILLLQIVTYIGFLGSVTVSAQENLPKYWDSEKIKGTTNYPYPAAAGHPYLTEKFVRGEIEFPDGTKISDIQMRYSEYRDEIIYYNNIISAQIIIDKISLKGFSFTDSMRVKHVFRQQYYNGFSPGNRFFEVLVDGEVSLLAYRKVVLETCAPYSDVFGRLNNMSYQETFAYYLYHPRKGYESIRINKNSFLTLFSKPNQIQVKKILRKNGVKLNSEEGLVKAWKLIKEKQIEVWYKFDISTIQQ
jgi:hypothetical protein